jgi:hypothetical protein
MNFRKTVHTAESAVLLGGVALVALEAEPVVDP